MARNRLPAEQLRDIPGDVVSSTLQNLNELRKLEPCQTDEEVKNRIDEYFAFCQSHGMRPGLETLALALGVCRTTLWNWRSGKKCTQNRTEIINMAVTFIAACLESLSVSGALNPVMSIWLMKNWLNYKDSADLTISTGVNNIAISEGDLKKISERYIDTEQKELPTMDYSAISDSAFETELPTDGVAE